MGEVKDLNSTQVNIQDVQLGDIVMGREVVTILDRQDDKLVILFFDGGMVALHDIYDHKVTVQR